MNIQAKVLGSELRRALVAFVAKRVGSGPDAEDIVQDIFLRLHEKLDQMRDPSRVLPWLYRTARNAIVDHFRSPVRRRMRPVGGAAEVEPHLPPSAGGEEEPVQARLELASCLRPLLEQLPADYRKALSLVDLEGLSQKSAAARLGLSLSSMKSRVQRGRRRLKRVLDDCCLVQLDRRGGVRGFEARGKPCGCER